MPTYETLQLGYVNLLGNWQDGGGFALVPGGNHGGTRFQLHTATVGGLALGPNIVSAATLGLVLEAVAEAGTLSVYGVLTTAPAAFSTSNRPGFELGEGLVGSVSVAGGAVSASVPLDLRPDLTGAVPWAMWRRGVWNGVWAFGLGWSASASTLGVTSASLATTELPELTGTSGVREHTRRCDVTGLLTRESELVEDGFRPGLRVRREAYDPPDMSDRTGRWEE